MAEENKEDTLEPEELLEEDTDTKEESKDTSKDSDSKKDGTNETSDEENEEFVKKEKKTNLIKKILIGVVGLLLLVLISGIIMFFLGFFDAPEPVESKEKMMAKKEIIKEDTSYKFNIKDINSKKLNKQLSMLTNKNIKEDEENEKREQLENEKKILEEEKKKQEEALALEEEKISQEKEALEAKKLELEQQKNELEALKAEAMILKEKMINDKMRLEKENLENEKMLEEKMTEEVVPETEEKVAMMEEEPIKVENNFISLINVAKIKGDLYKSYLDKVTKISPDISLCRDDQNRIELFFGPFESNENRKELFDKLIKAGFENAYEVELIKDEYNKRCKY